MSILSFFPGTPRPLQRDALMQIEANWDKADVFLMNLPTGVGKSRIAVCLSAWMQRKHKVKSVITTPTNILVDQYLRDNPKLATLKNKDSYQCTTDLVDGCESSVSCTTTKNRTGRYCQNCPYTGAIRKAHVMPYLVCNNHIYLAHKLARSALISDEAHNLIRVIKDRAGKVLWQHEYGFPSFIRSYSQLRDWLIRHPRLEEDKKLTALLNELEAGKTRFVINRTEEMFRNELRDCIKMSPVDVRDEPPIFWPKKVDKIFLLSATIGLPDIVQLGLDKRRVYSVVASSPVDAERRPVIATPLVNLSFGHSENETKKLAEFISEKLAAHPEKGLVHVTYSLAEKLKPFLTDGRIIWHTKEDAKEKYQEFLDSGPASGAVLFASGLYEGADLPYDQARWQILAKIPWPYLGEPAIKWKAETDQEWYLWETCKTVLQACGRIVRSVDDYGVTYVPDKSFSRLVSSSEKLLPIWWLDGLSME